MPPRFLAVRDCPDDHADERLEVTSALILGARFERGQSPASRWAWTCVDDNTKQSDVGWWQFKVNAARAYLATKGLRFTREGVPLEPPVPMVPMGSEDIDYG